VAWNTVQPPSFGEGSGGFLRGLLACSGRLLLTQGVVDRVRLRTRPLLILPQCRTNLRERCRHLLIGGLQLALDAIIISHEPVTIVDVFLCVGVIGVSLHEGKVTFS
jgi:hypothetical protein